MKSELHEYINQAGLCRDSVIRVAEMLPEDDAELDDLIAETVRESDSMGFMVVVYAAFSKGRPVDAKHLVGGARLAGGGAYLTAMMFSMQGDVPERLLEGMQNTAFHNVTQATAVFAAAIWCAEHRAGAYPDQLLPEARKIARRVKQVPEADIFLIGLALHAKDDALLGLMRQNYSIISDQEWKKLIATFDTAAMDAIRAYRTPILKLLPETPTFPMDPTQTVRRSVARIGRNDPCHCGSGKKYKNCHQELDRQRLQQSSGVAGHTLQELNVNPARHLTMERLEKTSASGLARMDPFEVPRHLLTDYFVRLTMFSIDRAADCLEKIVAKNGYADDLEDSWFFIMFQAARSWRKDIGERMMKLRPELNDSELRLSQRMLLAQDDPAKSLTLIEEAAEKALQSGEMDDLTDLTYAVGFSKYSALAVLMYRAFLAIADVKQMDQAYEQVTSIRERLKLAAEDPIHELVEARRDKNREETESALREAEEKFEAKRREVRGLRESLDQIQKELARRERVSAQEAAVSVTAGEDGAERLRELRQKVKNLEASLREKHEERNALQKELERAQTNVETLRGRAQVAPAVSPDDAEAAQEDDLLLTQEAEGNHPLRLIEFPRSFQERLSEFPHHVARGAMIMLGRLAGGDAAAFSGAKRLKSRPSVVRQRIGIDFRLLFRLLPDRIQVIDLIPRQDFERRIKALPL